MGFQPSTVWSKKFSTYPLEHTPDPSPESPTVYDLEVFPFGGLGMPGICYEDRFFSCVAVAGPWLGGRGRMAVAGGRVICMWSGWPAGRMAVAVAGRPACGRVAGWAAVAGWPVAVCMWSVAGWPDGRGRGRMAGWLFAWPDGRAMPKLCRARVEPRLASTL